MYPWFGGMYGSSRYLCRFPRGGSQHPQQLPQHLRHEKHEQQHERPQQAHLMMHQMTDRAISPPTMMTAITGHLQTDSQTHQPAITIPS